MGRKIKILLIEDEEPLLRGLVQALEYEGYEIDFSWDGNEGLKKAKTGLYDLVISDLMLPSINGLQICEQIRRLYPEQLFLMLTALGSEQEMQEGFHVGADDYLAKPFSLKILKLRIKALLRRSHIRFQSQYRIQLSDELSLDPENLCLRKRGEMFQVFTKLEIEILQYLHRFRHKAVARDELLREVWGYKNASHVETRTVDIHIARIRRKLGDPQLLLTLRGQGYRLSPVCLSEA